jgi:class 3 adenylate cyclase
VQGSSEFVIAVIIDIRGFSSFAMEVESVQTTAFLKRIYIEMVDRYFGNASFIKPTGDGLLLAFPHDETNLKEVASYVVRSSMACLADFAKLCDGDKINFNIPEKVGIGISRGAATNVVSHGSTIDYSGRPFNIASRLMDLARPSGVILDSMFGENLIPSDIKGKPHLEVISGIVSMPVCFYFLEVLYFPGCEFVVFQSQSISIKNIGI